MKISTEDLKYISGEKFDVGYEFQLKNNPLYERTYSLIQIVKGKSVIHIGCCDHLEIIDERIKNHEWLQGLLEENCNEVTGIDINEKSVNYVNDNGLSKKKVYCKNILDSNMMKNWDISFEGYDYVLLGEILEHVDNPVDFLSTMKNNFRAKGFKGNFIITVPNALSFVRSWRLSIKETELVNTDHRYWFTPFTISKVMYMAGIKPTHLLFASDKKGGNGKNIISEILYRLGEKVTHRPSKRNSILGDTLIAIGVGHN